MKNIRLYIIGTSLMLTLWMTASFTAQPQSPAPAPAPSQPLATPAPSQPVAPPVATSHPAQNESAAHQLAEPLARLK